MHDATLQGFQVVKALLKEGLGKEFTVEEIERSSGLSLLSNPLLLRRLVQSKKIVRREIEVFSDETGGFEKCLVFSFRNAEGLVVYLESHPVDSSDPKLSKAYKGVESDLWNLVQQRKALFLRVSHTQNVFFANKLPHLVPVPGAVKRLWSQTIQGLQNPKGMEEIRKRITEASEYAVLSSFPSLEEEASVTAQISDIKQRETSLKKRQRDKERREKTKTEGKGKRKANKHLSTIKLDMTIGGAEGATVDADEFNSEEERLLLDQQEENVSTPELPSNVYLLMAEIVRAFYEDEHVILFETLLNDGLPMSIAERQESVIAEKLLVQQDYVKKLCIVLKKDHIVKEKSLKLKTTRKYVKVATNDEFFDSMNYRVSALRRRMEETDEAEGWGPALHRIRELERKLRDTVIGVGPVPALITGDVRDDGEGVLSPSIPSGEGGIPIYLRENGEHNDGKYNHFMKKRKGMEGTNGGIQKKRRKREGSEDAEEAEEAEEKGEEEQDVPRIALDNPFPIQIAEDGKIYLPVIWKTWVEALAEGPQDLGEGKSEEVAIIEGEGRWVWSYSTRSAHLFLSFVATLNRYYSQVLEFEITEQSIWLARKYLGLTKTDVLHGLISFSGQPVEQFSPYLLHLLKAESPLTEEETVTPPLLPIKGRDYFGAKLVLEEGVYSLESRSTSILLKLQQYLGVTLPMLKRKKNGKCKLTPSVGQLLNTDCRELREREEGVCYFFNVMGDPTLGTYGRISEKMIDLKRKVYHRHVIGRDDTDLNGSAQSNGEYMEASNGTRTISYRDQMLSEEENGITDAFNEMLWRPYGNTETSTAKDTDSLPLIIDEFDYLTKLEADREAGDNNKEETEAAEDTSEGSKPQWYCEPLAIKLKESSRVRSYQKRAVSSLFWDGKAHSGNLVLPCGAGKTLVGIMITSILKHCCIIFCTSILAVNQWREQFLRWADIQPEVISRFTSLTKKGKEWNPKCGVLITTYNMFATGKPKAKDSSDMIEKCKKREWGLMILDEVHLAPAQTFRKVTTEFRARCKLGLTATMVREDNLISELPHLVGPKLYEVDLLSLKNDNCVADVHCFVITCPLTAQFKERYDEALSGEERRLLFISNPNKARICASLLQRHLARGDKILVFCDDLFGLQWFSKVLKSDFIAGSTPQEKREQWLHRFADREGGAFVLISKVGDHSIDLPDANVIIQMGVVDGSRMQEAQRLGRVQRKKAALKEHQSDEAYFYSIVSANTEEVGYSKKRRAFMEEHGYVYNDYDHAEFLSGDTEELIDWTVQRDVLEAIQKELEANAANNS